MISSGFPIWLVSKPNFVCTLNGFGKFDAFLKSISLDFGTSNVNVSLLPFPSKSHALIIIECVPADKVGSVKVGKDADLVLWSDHPLSVYAKAEKTIIEGVVYFDIQRDEEQRKAIAKTILGTPKCSNSVSKGSLKN